MPVSKKTWHTPVQVTNTMDISQREQNKNRPSPPLAVCYKY